MPTLRSWDQNVWRFRNKIETFSINSSKVKILPLPPWQHSPLCVNVASKALLLYFLWWKKEMCKTSTGVLNINFSESQTGVKGGKPCVSTQPTMRRWAAASAHTSRHIERAVTSSSPPPLKHNAPPLSDPCGQSSGCSAARAPVGDPREGSDSQKMSTN